MADDDELEARFAGRFAPLKASGEVALIVVRTAPGVHACPPSVEVTAEDGLVGDRWTAQKDPQRDAQATIMMLAAAEAVADGKSLDLPGDNFVVDLDLSEACCPVGTRIRLGAVLIEITDYPHTGCSKFRERVGDAALFWVNHKDNRARRLRGVNCRVLESGTVAIGDSAEIVR